jgi:hypothetical protein
MAMNRDVACNESKMPIGSMGSKKSNPRRFFMLWRAVDDIEMGRCEGERVRVGG